MQGIFGAQNLSVVYGKITPAETYALRDVSFDALSGEFVIIFGPSGCGKSTLLYTLSGIERHIDMGEVWVHGKDVAKMKDKDLLALHRHDMGMIFQSYNLVATLRVIHNVTLPLIAMGVPKKIRRKRAMDLLEHFGIKHLARRYPSELSGGQQQRVAVARSLVTDPDIIFADEPTGNLDSISTGIVMKQLLDLNQKDKKTILMVTHDPSFLAYADRVLHMKDGQILRVEVKQGQRTFVMSEKKEDTDVTATVNAFGTSPFDVERTGEYSFEEREKMLVVGLFVASFTKQKEPVLVKRLEHMLGELALGKLSKKDAMFALQVPVLQGGLGYLSSEAIGLILDVNKVFEVRSFIKNIPQEKRLSYYTLIHMGEWILGVSFKKMTSAQNDRFCVEMGNYLSARSDRSRFSFALNNSLERGGVGMFGVDTEMMFKKLELIEDIIPIENLAE